MPPVPVAPVRSIRSVVVKYVNPAGFFGYVRVSPAGALVAAGDAVW